MTDRNTDLHENGLPTGGAADEPEVHLPIGGSGAGQDGPIGNRLGHDPSNLGNDVTELGDVTHPAPDPIDSPM